ncbi:hypothetical protein KIW84_052873 [Lathyrus oleraceus]|uniref:Aminotransferase-like plant mobile domain-containing protein n=1 Tax=Pisum sativum TaxID=3888 RepID=A0A9D4WR67_PEA|nr:hypothetical protein KIW84_052873 [Pisum sativum]
MALQPQSHPHFAAEVDLPLYVLCACFVQVAKEYVSLATQLHEGRKICLRRLILLGFYESLGFSCEDLKERENPYNIQIGGPIWILQLWINAIFESFLKTKVPRNPEAGVEGLRMDKLTHNDGKVVSWEICEDYFQLFYR